jgi:hypothetical protein
MPNLWRLGSSTGLVNLCETRLLLEDEPVIPISSAAMARAADGETWNGSRYEIRTPALVRFGRFFGGARCDRSGA